MPRDLESRAWNANLTADLECLDRKWHLGGVCDFMAPF